MIVGVENFSPEQKSLSLTIKNNESTLEVLELTMPPLSKTTRTLENLSSQETTIIKATLEQRNETKYKDSFHLDNEAYALLPYHDPIKTLVVSKDNLYLEGALLSFEHVNLSLIHI